MFEVKLWENEIPSFTEGADTPNRMECHLLPGEKCRPAVIVYPGGGYSMRADHEGAPIAQFYNSCGYHGFVCHYRCMPSYYPAPLLDAQRAIKIVRAHADEWHIDPERIFTLGFSAGGHLCSMTVTMPDICKVGDGLDSVSTKPNGGILCYPVISIAEDFGHVGSGKCLLGPDATKENIEKLCTQNAVDADTPPCFLWHTSEDKAVPVRNSLEFAAKLHAFKIPFELHIFPHGWHGLGLALDYPDVRQWAPLSADWIKRNFPDKEQ